MALVIGLCPTAPHALTVFDPLNYEQNLLSAIRALDTVENQIRQLQNQAQALTRMDRNLLPQSGSIGPQLQTHLVEPQSAGRPGRGARAHCP